MSEKGTDKPRQPRAKKATEETKAVVEHNEAVLALGRTLNTNLALYTKVKNGEEQASALGPNAKHIAHGAVQALSDLKREFYKLFPGAKILG